MAAMSERLTATRAVADIGRADVGGKMHAFDQRVGNLDLLRARCGLQHCTIITNADDGTGRLRVA